MANLYPCEVRGEIGLNRWSGLYGL